jgi:hypothetical protein
MDDDFLQTDDQSADRDERKNHGESLAATLSRCGWRIHHEIAPPRNFRN